MLRLLMRAGKHPLGRTTIPFQPSNTRLHATNAKTHKIGTTRLTKMDTKPPSYEEFKKKFMPSFERDLDHWKKVFPDKSEEILRQEYEETCRGQFKTHIEKLTSDNDPDKLL